LHKFFFAYLRNFGLIWYCISNIFHDILIVWSPVKGQAKWRPMSSVCSTIWFK